MKTNETIKEIIGRITVYKLDISLFINDLVKVSDNKSELFFIKQKTEELTTLIDLIFTEESIDKKINYTEKLILTADFLLTELKELKCDDKFLNEKTDLIAKTFMIFDKAENLRTLIT
ncbi:MAG: hypothetical protein GXO80_05920 [Chlorobi bacterium]|nr:hypothetical protein [Chlorobiota bacterium]